MTEEAKAARREYMRQWRTRNKDRVKRYSENYFQKLADRAKTKENEESHEKCENVMLRGGIQ